MLTHTSNQRVVLILTAKDVLFGAWKLVRVLKPRAVYSSLPLCGGVSYVSGVAVRDLARECSEEERQSIAMDDFATGWIRLVAYPLIAALATYNLSHYEYRSWWSWGVSSAADAVYFFGFASMLPQLYINYKLRSVAHLPVRAFAYKVFNTFVDDAFVLLVNVPLKHKIMALRDDVVFLGFVAQWWIYPVDKARVNEFGFQYEGTEADKKGVENALERDGRGEEKERGGDKEVEEKEKEGDQLDRDSEEKVEEDGKGKDKEDTQGDEKAQEGG
jgi:hypothetical protein